MPQALLRRPFIFQFFCPMEDQHPDDAEDGQARPAQKRQKTGIGYMDRAEFQRVPGVIHDPHAPQGRDDRRDAFRFFHRIFSSFASKRTGILETLFSRGMVYRLKTSGLTTNWGRRPERTSTTPSAAPVAMRITHSCVSAALCGDRRMFSSAK